MNTIKPIIWRIRAQTKEAMKWLIAIVSKRLGYTLLTKKQTVAYLNEYLMATYPTRRVMLPKVWNAADPAKIIFRETEVVTAPSRVWQYKSANQRTWLLRCGLLLTDNKVLNTDFGNDDALLEVFGHKNRPQHQTQTLLAPLGHYFDGNRLVGYYDFMFLIAVKLCRIKESVPEDIFRQAVVSYPLVNTDYEREFLDLMGFGSDQVFDSRLMRVHGETCYLGNHDNWTHQNPADIFLLKKHLEPLIQSPRTGRNRVYISRIGRRRVLNEVMLVELLSKYGFIIIDDKPRSLVEQYAIYHNASFIMGPHGASFTNLLWCEPGTHLFELFAAEYAPPHFLYLAEVLGLRYSAYCQDAIGAIDYGAIGSDVSVSIPELERCLDKIFQEV